MDKNKEAELLNILHSLSVIYEREQEDDYIEPLVLIIGKYKIKFNFIYKSVSIVISNNNTFNVFFFTLDKKDDMEIKEVGKLFSLLDLPPNLLITKLNQVGIQKV